MIPLASNHRRERPTLGQRQLDVLFFVAVLLGTLAGALPVLGPSTHAANVTITLYGKATPGWSTSPGAETNPGPNLIVNEGDHVTMQLTSEDGAPHTFWIDYDGDGVVDSATEPNSPEFTSTLTYAFDASVAGTFHYYCGVHSPPIGPNSLMRGTWITRGKPAVTISAPSAGTSWSGGVAHDIVFDLQSADPPDGVTIWVNYTYNAGATGGRIAGPIPGTANPNVVSWSPVGLDATDVVVNVTAIDTGGMRGFRTSAPFEVDSTAPSVVSESPAPSASDVPLNAKVRVTWSEGMNETATGSRDAFGVAVGASGPWTPGTVSWSTDARQATFIPAAPFLSLTTYEVHVNTTAKDDSAPGNPIAAPVTWTFTTGQAPDTVAPTISAAAAVPAAQGEAGYVNVTAEATDDVALAGVSAHVVGPAVDVNLTMSKASGSRWFANRTYLQKGTYAFTIWAIDSSGNVASRSGSFVIRDVTPPSVPTAVSATVRSDGSVLVTWEAVTAADLLGYRVYRRSASGGPYTNLTPTPILASAPRQYIDTMAEPGATHVYVVTAVDLDGNESPFSNEASAAVPPRAASVLPFLVAGVVVVGIGVMVGLLWRRLRRRPPTRLVGETVK